MPYPQSVSDFPIPERNFASANEREEVEEEEKEEEEEKAEEEEEKAEDVVKGEEADSC